MQRVFLSLIGLLLMFSGFGQRLEEGSPFLVEVLNEKNESAPGASVEMYSVPDSSLQKAGVTDSSGLAIFEDIPAGEYFFRISRVGYHPNFSAVYKFPLAASGQSKFSLVIHPLVNTMQDVTVVGTRPFVQHVQGKVLI